MNNLQLQVVLSAVDKLTAPFRNTAKAVSQLSSTLKVSRTELNNVKKQMREHQSAIESYRNKINPLKNSLDETNSKLKEAKTVANRMEQAMKGMSQPTEAFKNKLKQAKQAVASLERAQIVQSNKLRQAREEMQRNGVSASQLAQRQRELKRQMDSATQSVKKQEEQLEKLNQRNKATQRYRQQVEGLKATSERLQNLGQRAIISGTTLTAPIGNAVKDYVELEDAMAGVARQVPGLKDQTGKFTAEYGEWQKKIKNLAKELPLTTVEIANMIEAAARMDTPKEQLEEFVRLNTQMATAFDAANPDELVEQFGKVSKNFKLSAESTRDLADAINYLDDNAISKGTSIIGFMNRVSGIAGIAKITEKNMAALGSTLQTAGAEEEASATAVNAIFTRLSSASKKKPVRNALSALGLSASQVELGMVKDAQGTIMKIVDTLKKMPEQKRLGFIADLVGTEHTKTLALLVSNTEEWRRQIALANSEEAKGSMGREFETRMTTLSAKWQTFKNRLFNVNTAFGATLREQLIGLMDSIGGVLDKIESWVNANPELAASIVKWVAVGGGALLLIGALTSAFSFVLYPIGRTILAISKFTGVSKLMNRVLKDNDGNLRLVIKSLFNYKTTANLAMAAGTATRSRFFALGGVVKGLPTGFIRLIGSMRNVSFWLKLLKVVGFSVFLPLKALLIGVGSVLGFLASPISLLVVAFVAAGALIYKYWDQIKAFFSGFFEGLKSGLAPVIERFKPLGELFGVLVGWLKKAWSWFTDLFTPIKATQQNLDAAASAGKKFGEWFAMGIDILTKPLQWVMDAIEWILGKMPQVSDSSKDVNQAINTGKTLPSTGVVNQMASIAQDSASGKLVQMAGHATGGYVGNGAKYQPMGIVHGGEYVMTKEATSRLGVATLNALNYGKQALIAGGLGVSVATAAPIQIDNRPPLVATQQAQQVTQPMNVNITINATANQNPQDIAREVARQLAIAQSRQQAQARNRMIDKD